MNQAFYPDVVATGQYLTDLALELVRNGHEVSVMTGRHGYDDFSKRFKPYEEYQGIKIHRISYLSLGKASKAARFFDFASFNFCLGVKLLFFPKQDRVIGLTSPPLIAVFGNLFCGLKGGRFLYWVMDLNPDEAMAAGWLKEKSLATRILKCFSRWAFQKSTTIVALDRFMKERIIRNYGIDGNKIVVIPPWANEKSLHPVHRDQNSFRKDHAIGDKFVVMYSGNHSPCHPLATVLQAALRCREDNTLLFYFIGGGSRVQEIKAFKEKNNLKNIIQLGYEPLEKLSESLSAADLQVTVMGDEFVGIVHPCKIYGILSVGRPFVFIGPQKSAMGDFIQESGLGAPLEHGDVQTLLAVIEKTRKLSPMERKEIEEKSLKVKEEKFSHQKLCSALTKLIESND